MSAIAKTVEVIVGEEAEVVEIQPVIAVPENRVVKAAGPMAQKVMNGLDIVGLGFINPFIRLAYCLLYTSPSPRD